MNRKNHDVCENGADAENAPPSAKFATLTVELPPGLPKVGQMKDSGLAPPAHIPYSGGCRYYNYNITTASSGGRARGMRNPNRSSQKYRGSSSTIMNSSRTATSPTESFTAKTKTAANKQKKLESFQLVKSGALTATSVPILGISNGTDTVKYPLLLCSQEGTIMLSLAAGVLIEICVDRSFRLVYNDDVMIYVNNQGSVSSILHKYAKIVHFREHVHCKFLNANDRLAVIGPEGVLFSMKSLAEAYLVSGNSDLNAEGGRSVVALQKPDFPIQNFDYTLHQMYAESRIGDENLKECNRIVNKSGYEKKKDGSLYIHINGMIIRFNSETEEVLVEYKPVKLTINLKTLAVNVRSAYIEMAVQDRDKCFVKKGDKRIHTSRSGMVVSDGTCTVSMDQRGKILSCS